jgi:catechol 2,3-dioxygenase-like lactoylglutathione lyase family enzyme
MVQAAVGNSSPFFIVSNVDQSVAFYRDKLGFETRFEQPGPDRFFAIIGRGGAQIFFKSDKSVEPLPNPKRHPWMAWDAFVYVPDPDALAAESENPRLKAITRRFADARVGLPGVLKGGSLETISISGFDWGTRVGRAISGNCLSSACRRIIPACVGNHFGTRADQGWRSGKNPSRSGKSL